MQTVTLRIEGMHCDACVRRVKIALEKSGVKVLGRGGQRGDRWRSGPSRRRGPIGE